MNLNKLTTKAQEAIAESQSIAFEFGHSQINSLHLLLALLKEEDGIIEPLLKQLDLNPQEITKEVENEIKKTPRIEGDFEISASSDLQKIILNAQKIAQKSKDDFISTDHLFQGFFETKNPAQEILIKLNLNKKKVSESISKIRGSEKITDDNPESQFQALEKYSQNLTELARKGKLDPVIGRDDEIRRIMQVLSRRTKNNPVLIGEPGTGKTAIVEGLAQRIIEKDVPDSLKDKEILTLDLASLIAGAKYRGEFENRLKTFLKEIEKQSGKIILFIDELHTLVGAGAQEGQLDASNMLKPALARGTLHAIGATTLKEYQKYIEKDSALERRFQPTFVKEPNIEDTLAILRGIKEKYEVHHGVRITDRALIAASELSQRYITDRYLPDKAIDLIDEAASSLRISIDSLPPEIDELKRKIIKLEIEKNALQKEKDLTSKDNLQKTKKNLAELKEKATGLEMRWKNEKEIILKNREFKKEIEELKNQSEKYERKGELDKVAEIQYGKIPQKEKLIKAQEIELKNLQKGRPILYEEVDEEDIAKIVSRWTNIPVSKILKSEAEKLANIEESLSKRVIGQKEAINAISNAIRRSRAGISEENKPIGSFIFLGPTGVGKTELAKTLAETMFNDENTLVRLDMSEYQEKHSIAKIIGSPPGYVGFDEGGQLAEIIRKRPYSVILFDEIEKAHPEVFDILLQILDDGRLTDAKGRVVNFKNTIIILTSNLGSNLIKDKVAPKTKDSIFDLLASTFKPEFLNRLDDIIIFHPLSKKEIREIVDLQLDKVVLRLKKQKITLKFSNSLKDYLAQKGYDPTFGARPLKRVIQNEILDELALQIIEKKIKSNDKIKIDLKDDKVILEKEK